MKTVLCKKCSQPLLILAGRRIGYGRSEVLAGCQTKDCAELETLVIKGSIYEQIDRQRKARK